jgi:hypothetical protein
MYSVLNEWTRNTARTPLEVCNMLRTRVEALCAAIDMLPCKSVEIRDCFQLHGSIQVMGVVIPSTQRHYRRLILLLNTAYTATCFGRTAIFKQKYIIS